MYSTYVCPYHDTSMHMCLRAAILCVIYMYLHIEKWRECKIDPYTKQSSLFLHKCIDTKWKSQLETNFKKLILHGNIWKSFAHACNYTMLTTYFCFPAPGERWTADDGDVAGDVVGGRAEPGRPVALVNGNNGDGGRASGYRRRHDSGGWHRTGLLWERQTHDDGSGNGANGVQLPVR